MPSLLSFHHPSSLHSPVQQRGATLVIVLIFLLMLTLIGVAGMQDSTKQEHMAGNMRNRNLAFQAAEAALRIGEKSLDQGRKVSAGSPMTPNCTAFNPPPDPASFKPDGTGGFLTMLSASSNNHDYWSNYDWSTKSKQIAANTLAEVTEQPRYVVEDISTIDSICTDLRHKSTDCYRVTARGVGGTTDTVVILQSTYKARKVDCL